MPKGGDVTSGDPMCSLTQRICVKFSASSILIQISTFKHKRDYEKCKNGYIPKFP